ncbi:MAG: hypothetical protein K2I89_09695, partial [Muribaculaceae bacterium]|nr:hypothetical protein [Muribaculaceae bacterium]
LKMGVVFTEQKTTTHRFSVSNPASKSLAISHIGLSGDAAEYFRLNVDGFSGREFNNVEIRGKDSIFVFVEATLPTANADLPVEMNAFVDFTTNGVSRSVVLSALGQDVIRLNGLIVDNDTHFDSAKPYQIFDSLVVAQGATLTLAPGTRLLFHDSAYLAVDGTLISDGTVEQPVILSGDRTGNVVTDISFDLMSRQWKGVIFGAGSKNNDLRHTEIKNTNFGVIVDGEEAASAETSLVLTNCRLHNSGATVLTAYHADIDAVGCEFAEGSEGLVTLVGGSHSFNHCTFANNYLFTAISGPAIAFSHFNGETDDQSQRPYLTANIDNSIIYGLGQDLSHGDFTDTEIFIRNCLMKSEGNDDDNFLNCIWGEDPLYYTVRSEYLFDYRLKADSPAIGAADASLSSPRSSYDAYGNARGAQPDLGAYVYVAD